MDSGDEQEVTPGLGSGRRREHSPEAGGGSSNASEWWPRWSKEEREKCGKKLQDSSMEYPFSLT
ncbi:hypothetical protein SOVF_214120, partial [Spinacia oleracea]